MGYLILAIWLVVLPTGVGYLVNNSEDGCALPVQWTWGQFILWAIFQPVAVFCIIQRLTLQHVIMIYVPIAIVIGGVGLIVFGYKWTKVEKAHHTTKTMWTKKEKLFLIVFGVLWILQMAVILFGAVNDGDDAFYMAVANITENSDYMYLTDPYAYGAWELDYRYALAPFPVWIAFLSRISGIHTLIIGHVLLGILLITMSYIIYAEMARVLFDTKRESILLFLIGIAILYLWGNTSSHTAESFLILRTRQGKALVAGIVFPAMVCVLVRMGKLMEESQKIRIKQFILAMSVLLSGCLGSSMGGALLILLWGSGMFFLSVEYRRFKILMPSAMITIPGLIFVFLYLSH